MPPHHPLNLANHPRSSPSWPKLLKMGRETKIGEGISICDKGGVVVGVLTVVAEELGQEVDMGE